MVNKHLLRPYFWGGWGVGWPAITYPLTELRYLLLKLLSCRKSLFCREGIVDQIYRSIWKINLQYIYTYNMYICKHTYIYRYVSKYVYYIYIFRNVAINIYYIYRRKFRSLTSDNMERWKAEQRSRVRRKKIQSREMLGKSRIGAFVQWFVGREDRKVGSLKRRVRRSLFSREMNNLHAAVARSTFPSQNAKKLTGSDHFLKLGCRKIARRCCAKHICKSKCTKHTRSSFWS